MAHSHVEGRRRAAIQKFVVVVVVVVVVVAVVVVVTYPAGRARNQERRADDTQLVNLSLRLCFHDLSHGERIWCSSAFLAFCFWAMVVQSITDGHSLAIGQNWDASSFLLRIFGKLRKRTLRAALRQGARRYANHKSSPFRGT